MPARRSPPIRRSRLQADPDTRDLAIQLGNDLNNVKNLRGKLKDRLEQLIRKNGDLVPDAGLVPALMDVAQLVLTQMGYGWAFEILRPRVERIITKLISERRNQGPGNHDAGPPPVTPHPNGNSSAPQRLRVTGGYLEFVPETTPAGPNGQPGDLTPDDGTAPVRPSGNGGNSSGQPGDLTPEP